METHSGRTIGDLSTASTAGTSSTPPSSVQATTYVTLPHLRDSGTFSGDGTIDLDTWLKCFPVSLVAVLSRVADAGSCRVRINAEMPGKCCVPRCNGNYKTGPKVHVFSFPQADEARQAWIRAIPRENLVVSANARVCERHFKAEDIVRKTSNIDQATGRTVTAPLSRLRLRAEAVPTVFPDCPSYLSIESSRREDPESKRMRLEAASLEKVLTESILTAKKEEEADKLCDLKDVANFIRGKKLTFWHVIECSGHVILAHICNDDAPWIKYSVVVKTDLTLTVNVAKASVKWLGSKMVVPSVINSKRRLLELLEGVEGFDSAQRSSSENSTADIFETVASLLNELYTAQESDNTLIIQLLAEQVKLMSTKKERRRYSVEFIVYCYILFTISPHAYKYMRSHGSIVMPHPRTIRAICSSFGMNPQLDRAPRQYIPPLHDQEDIRVE
ncbi:hypothetical protein HPB51_013518 [Rhipicephalus microplus]|uniref:THAP-type domain-containing protein n=1 Tax=Rhipicephalus microplus TaxID=6941 RepID=A0A9J6E1G9_RHIMP|nr:hypothetical protein HPB51_013518 [Rhipicephalus microplus]